MIDYKKPRSLQKEITKCDEVFSKYIRLKYITNGIIRCFTCGKILIMSKTDAGHFVGREHKTTRFLEKNVHPQCQWCNRFKEGAKDEYALNLVKKYGPGILEELNQLKHGFKQYTLTELDQLKEFWKSEIKRMTADN